MHEAISLSAIGRYNIPLHVPDSGMAISDLAARLSTDEQTLTRLIRHAIVKGVFQELEPGFITHTPISRILREDEDCMNIVKIATEDLWPCALRVLDALEKWHGSPEPPHTAWNLANDTTEPFFDFLAKRPERLKRIASMFRIATQSLTQAPNALYESPLWVEIDKPGTTVVDVGGNRGYVSLGLARATKHIKFVVEDRPEVVKLGEECLPSEYRDRVSFTAHDFFSKQPLQNADVYFLRKILHDWSDHLCVQILLHLVPALKPGARIVVCETVLPEMAKPGYEQELLRWVSLTALGLEILKQDNRNSDLGMLMCLNGCERTESDWRKLFASADERFKLDFEYLEGGVQGLIKATWQPDCKASSS